MAAKGTGQADAAGAYLPVQIDQVRLFDRPGRRVHVHARLVEHGPSRIKGDIRLLDEAGTVRAEVRGFVCRPVGRGTERWDNYLYEYQWKRSEEHTSELQSRQYLVCRLLLEKKKREPSVKELMDAV